MDLHAIMRDYVDYLVPRLDTYEQVLYVFILRQTHLNGNAEATIGFKSARRKMGFGIGEKGKPMSENVAYQRLKSLAQKGCVEILDSLRDGTRLRLRLPSEIPGLIPAAIPAAELDLEEMDFFTVPQNREFILKREQGKCFYCLRGLDASNYVIEQQRSAAQPLGNNCGGSFNVFPYFTAIRVQATRP